jgi:DNA polymerase/3'-5' exonuclease PolX
MIADQLHEWAKDACEYEPPLDIDRLCTIAGGLRRHSEDVHDIEIVAKPTPGAPRPVFGEPPYKTEFDKVLARLEKDGYLRSLMGGEKLKKYEIHMQRFDLPSALSAFKVEFYLCTPPAQYGVLLMIRTGPGKDEDNFSQYIVTPRRLGGALPDGYRVKYAAVWREEQMDAKDEPIKGQLPLSMPGEVDFFDFLGLPWIEPMNRHAMWRRKK